MPGTVPALLPILLNIVSSPRQGASLTHTVLHQRRVPVEVGLVVPAAVLDGVVPAAVHLAAVRVQIRVEGVRVSVRRVRVGVACFVVVVASDSLKK